MVLGSIEFKPSVQRVLRIFPRYPEKKKKKKQFRVSVASSVECLFSVHVSIKHWLTHSFRSTKK